MADLSTTCAVLVWYLELILVLHNICGVLPPSEIVLEISVPVPHNPIHHAARTCMDCVNDFELGCAFLCMAMALAPMVHAVARANKVPLWRSLLNLVLSAATVFCTSVEFMGAFHNIDLGKKLLPYQWFPLIVSSVVLVARVVEKRHAATIGDLPSGGSRARRAFGWLI